MRTTSGSRRRTAVALVTVLLLIVGLVGVAFAIANPAENDDEPVRVDSSPTLTLSRSTNVSGQAGADSSALGGGGYQLTGTLGTDTTTGVVISPATSTATSADVTRLLTALGMDNAAPKKVDGGWTASGTADGRKAAFALDERAGNVWQYLTGDQADCLSIRPGADPDSAVSCAVADVAQPPATETKAPGPGKAALLAAARDVFSLVGVTPGSGLKANDSAGVTYLDVPLSVEGLPVVDVTLSIGADDTGIVTGFGWLKPTFTTVGKYPLISATEGYADLLAQPQPLLAEVCEQGTDCGSAPQKVTAARLAWLTSRNGDGTVLVPAWQFEVDGFYGPAVVAVAPKYLSTPTPVAIDPGTGSGTDPSGGSIGGSVGTASSEPGATGAPDSAGDIAPDAP